MPLIHHVITGQGRLPNVFVHGFGCAHSDWDAQVAHLSPRHQTVAVDLRGHGASPGTPDECSIDQHGADVAEIMRALALPPAVLVGHSMGCRVVVEAAFAGDGPCGRCRPGRWQPVRPSYGSHAEGDACHA
jgi:pimeloyl-ACP methyl ester carboxylesterase